MKLFEVIEAPLYMFGLESINRGLPNWLTLSIKTLDQYTDKAQYRDAVRQLPDDGYSEDRDNFRDRQYEREYHILVREDNPGLHEYLVKSLKEMLEKQLREAAVSYTESQFGKVERIVPKEPYEIMKKRHLYFMQFVAVHIDTEGKYKSGKPYTGGGYFSSNPSKTQMGDAWSQKNIDWGNELGFGIKIYSTDNAIWLAAVSVLINHLQTEHFGEPVEHSQGFDNLLRNILEVWVHETTHMEQWTRRYLFEKIFYKYDWGLSYSPQVKQRPKYKIYDKETGRQKEQPIRGGVRGNPSHLENEDATTMSEWIEYFGTAHEIEAHAAGAAAQIIHDLTIQNRGYLWHGDNYYQTKMNDDIDSAIKDISYSYGNFNDVHSLRNYYNHIRNEAMRYLRLNSTARDRDISRDPRALNKVNIGARKVWKIFLTKLVKHLQAYKKPVRRWDERNPRFRLPVPMRKPDLPG